LTGLLQEDSKSVNFPKNKKQPLHLIFVSSWHTIKKNLSLSYTHTHKHTQMSNSFCNHFIRSTWYVHSFHLVDKCLFVIYISLLTPTTGFVSCTLFIPVAIMHLIAQIILQMQNILVNTELSCYENSVTITTGLPAG